MNATTDKKNLEKPTPSTSALVMSPTHGRLEVYPYTCIVAVDGERVGAKLVVQ